MDDSNECQGWSGILLVCPAQAYPGGSVNGPVKGGKNAPPLRSLVGRRIVDATTHAGYIGFVEDCKLCMACSVHGWIRFTCETSYED